MEALKNNDEEEYSKLVFELMDQEEEITTTALDQGASFIGISSQDIED